MVVEEITITLSGGAPWGFRLQGGAAHQRPLQVAKVRKRSKACRAGLREGDELVSINENSCEHMSHAQVMNFIDSIPGSLRIRVKRAPAGFQSVVLVARAPSPRIDKEYRAALRAKSPSSSKMQQSSVRQAYYSSPMSQTVRSGVTSPFGSEAYYGETDSDADVAAHDRHRKQKRRSPSNSPGKAGYTSPEMGEASEMSGYDSAPDVQGYTRMGHGSQEGTLPGVVRREVVYQPPPSGAWSSQTSTETSSMSADEQSSQDLVLEEDSGFQEPANVPLVSPERAKGALRLSSHSQLVPMVGPVDKPVDEELTKTYMDKAKQAKLNRGETPQDKQVKEARKKCRTIASLLTDAPNPHSKGVLMFKKRRQRSKKYTLTSYGSVDEDMQQDSQEEDSHFLGSESEVDEEEFSAAPDPTWDSGYLDILEKRSASRGLEENEAEDSLSTGLSDTTGKGAKLFEQQRKRAKEHAKKISIAQAQPSLMQSQSQPEIQTQGIQTQPSNLSVQVKKQVKLSVQPPPVAPKPTKPPELLMQEEACASKTQITGFPPQVIPFTVNEHTASIPVPVHSLVPVTNQPITAALAKMPPPTAPLPELPASSVLNRTARPFAPGFISHRAATAPVMFHPTTAKKTPRPVSVAVVAPPFSTPSDQKVIDVPSASFTVSQMSAIVPAEVSSILVSVPTDPLSYSAIADPAASLTPHPPSSMENIQPSIPQTIVPDSSIPASGITATPPASLTDPTTIASIASSQFTAPESSMIPDAPMTSAVPASPVGSMTPLSPVVYQEKTTEIAPAAGGKTGILQEARRRSASKPMFKVFDSKKNSPNPELLSLVQNLDERHKQAYTEPVSVTQDSYNFDDRRGRLAPPVAPKPRIIPEMSQIPQAEGKGAELFARRQNRRDLFVIDSPPSHTQQQQQQQQQQYTQPQSAMAMIHPCESSPWKYSPNVRAPPPIGYNPLLSPSCPLGLQRGGAKASERSSKVGKSGHGFQKEGIKAIDFIRRQPYQLNSAMFRFGGDSSKQSLGPSYQRQPQVGHTLTQPRQVPVKAARVYEIKRFSTPTPMSAPTISPTVIAPRAQTTLAEPLFHSDITSPTPATASPPPQPVPVNTAMSARAPGLPDLPKISATPIFLPTPYSPPDSLSSVSSIGCHGLQATKQFKSAPELSSLPPVPLKPTVQAPKPRFIATRMGIQPHVWRPGAL
ncbi:synaptopodin 2-like protein isoform X1 [Pangasianodon hypophthalmus]|uniref:synaptopodin 2-like protein isoform X1 n=2 Tax=Pangasianodon hypophthalmus TaxID=310915 RepID=UPI002307E529|nr:synaptopodin 2-like protein isoform X1 [Pangasianodon hypophthalmus]